MRKGKNPFKTARIEHNQHGKQSVPVVSKETGLVKSLIEDLESNSGKIRDTGYLKIAKLAEYYGVSIDFLAGISDCPSSDIDIRAICKYTGLSEKAVTILHQIQEFPESDIDDSSIVNHNNTRLINMVLEDACDSIKGITSEDELPLLDTLFSRLFRYISASDAEFSVRSLDGNSTPQEIETAKKTAIINFKDISYIARIRELSRPILLDQIRTVLDRYSERYDQMKDK